MKRQQILVVDREPAFLKTAREALEDLYEVSVASTRSEGLEKAEREAPDMVIIGFLEPRGDAFKLHKELKKSTKTNRMPLLVVDVRPEEHARKGWRREEGAQLDAEDYISRPIEPAELAELVGDILETATPRPVELDHIFAQMERVLKRMEKIEKLLVK
ncbi:Alkaline phosphatase synthesis transcriptional regulatory protein PhoP [subsurface metagenome]